MDGDWLMAFFKVDPVTGSLLTGPNFVLNSAYELYAELKDTYEYPVDGWHWFETEDEARTTFGLPPAEDISPEPVFSAPKPPAARRIIP